MCQVGKIASGKTGVWQVPRQKMLPGTTAMQDLAGAGLSGKQAWHGKDFWVATVKQSQKTNTAGPAGYHYRQSGKDLCALGVFAPPQSKMT
jgi:hypothetical protein